MSDSRCRTWRPVLHDMACSLHRQATAVVSDLFSTFLKCKAAAGAALVVFERAA
jgi:hypothetical protein